MTEENLPNGHDLVSELFGQMMRNWGIAGCPATTSKENWRFTKHVIFDDKNRSPEVLLERTIAKVTGDQWANQIPVDSGLLDKSGKTLDLACHNGDFVDLIELKVAANTPLSAAIQVLNYGLANVFFQINHHRVLPSGSENQLLNAKQLRLHVLAPTEFYQRFEKVSAWLREFEASIRRGVVLYSAQFLNSEYPRVSQFCFQAFPAGFHWDPSRHNDGYHQQAVKDALEQRFCYFS
ncbi:hypothetical protein GCM10023156_52940 [Novipirellula rosea]|uniref:Uncharacterized protein n=2 Tax=Novipirellula rosea TaxID=1031540 RepID=A0ABP8NGD0_9BACT